jgi:hypothetical protein
VCNQTTCNFHNFAGIIPKKEQKKATKTPKKLFAFKGLHGFVLFANTESTRNISAGFISGFC